jgi:glutamate 5-kinase
LYNNSFTRGWSKPVAGELIVVKYGSSSVTNEHGMDQDRLDLYASQLVEVTNELVVVTSGAVMTGRAEAPHITDEQVLAGIGSAGAVMAWKCAFKKVQRVAGQTLVTDHEIEPGDERDTLQAALRRDIENAVVPLINTNDKLSLEELPKRRWGGENDKLSAHIAELVGAGALFLMTDQDGLLIDDHETVREIPFAEDFHDLARNFAGDVNEDGQGMPSKVDAAISAASSGIDVYIARAGESLGAIMARDSGTHFAPNPHPTVE